MYSNTMYFYNIMYHTGLDYEVLDVVTYVYFKTQSLGHANDNKLHRIQSIVDKTACSQSKNRKEQLDLTRCPIDHSSVSPNLILNDEQCLK